MHSFLDRVYVDSLCEEINDSLQENGQISVADISKSFALPNSFLLEVRTYIVSYILCTKEVSEHV